MSRPLNLLAVEDNPRDVRLLQIALSEVPGLPHKLEVVGDIASAHTRLRTGGIDVVLLDLGLPGSQGTQTLVNFQKGAPDLPVVVLTGLADEQAAMEAARMGAQDYLVKGRMFGELLPRVLRYAVERHRILAELRTAVAGKK